MTKFKTHKKKGAAAIITAAVLALIALFGMAACSNAAQSGTGTDGSTAPPAAPFVEGGASLILSPDKLDIQVKAVTSDGSAIAVEGCTETELTSGTETVLYAKGTVVILKGKIIELNCRDNRLTALNVQGCTALRTLNCWSNQLNADAFKKLFTDLPKKQDGDGASCVLYTEQTGVTEGNCKDFSAPQDLTDAFNKAKNKKKWKMYKWNGSWPGVEI